MLDDEALEALQQGTFELHCLDVRVARPGTEGPELRGSGRIYQRGRQLAVTVYLPGQGALGSVSWAPPGSIVSEDVYCSLTATDGFGKRWSCPRFIPRLTWIVALDGALLRCDLPFLRGVDELPPGDRRASFCGYVFRPLGLPTNCITEVRTERGSYRGHSRRLDAAQFSAADFDFLLHETADRTSLIASGEGASLPPCFGDRVLEALQFVASELLAWDASIESDGGAVRAYIRGKPLDRGRPRVGRPVPDGAMDSAEHTWRLFDRYLRYVLCDQSDRMHRLSAEWGLVLQGSVGSLQTEATISTAVVESVCRFLESPEAPLAPRDDSREREAQRYAPQILEAIDKAGIPPPLRERVAGFVRAIQRGQPTDLLYQLAEAGKLDPSLIEAWKRLRNASAHGDREGQGEVLGLLADCERVVTLLYQLCFLAIGYAGPYADYSELEWRRGTYPPTRETGSGPGASQNPSNE